MNTIAFANLMISLVLESLLVIAYTFFLNRKKITDRKQLALIALTTFGIGMFIHWFIIHYIYFTPTFVLLLFFTLPFLVCLVVSSLFVLGKKVGR